jgi:hypothetical protein
MGWKNNKFPYSCKVRASNNADVGKEFIPTQIDYENRQVWWQQGQASGNGEWLDFSSVDFIKNPDFVDPADKNDEAFVPDWMFDGEDSSKQSVKELIVEDLPDSDNKGDLFFINDAVGPGVVKVNRSDVKVPSPYTFQVVVNDGNQITYGMSAADAHRFALAILSKLNVS